MDSDAPKWCDGLITTPVQQMAAALPDLALGGSFSQKASPKVLAGVAALRSAAGDMPDETATAARDTADTLAALVAQPGSRKRFNETMAALSELDTDAHKECGL